MMLTIDFESRLFFRMSYILITAPKTAVTPRMTVNWEGKLIPKTLTKETGTALNQQT